MSASEMGSKIILASASPRRRELLEQWSYGASLLETMTDAARENPNLQVIFDSGADTAFYI